MLGATQVLDDSALSPLLDRLDRLERLFNTHLGSQGSSSTQNIPHPQLSAIARGAYVTTNVVVDRTYDADATSTDELADILGTLILDLQSRKIIG